MARKKVEPLTLPIAEAMGFTTHKSADNPLPGMLSVLLSSKMKAEEKEAQLYDVYGIEASTEMKEGLTTMCNLSYGIAEEAKKEGLEEGREEGREEMILKCLRAGKTCEQIAEFNEISLLEVQEVEKKYL